ncbi:MAG: hypothetical protein HYV96_11080 [Opitutae bacterium]|nr:hypothetical protein [Opitutae bacterium]
MAFLATFALIALPHASSQMATDLNMGATMSVGDTDPPTWRFSWWGRSGRHYLVQVSLDLQTWSFLPATNPSGSDAPITAVAAVDYDPTGMNSNADAPKLFFRAIEFDPSSPSTAASDADSNGIPDEWERYYFGATGVSPNVAPDSDGVPALVKFRLGLKSGASAVSTSAATTELKVHFPN